MPVRALLARIINACKLLLKYYFRRFFDLIQRLLRKTFHYFNKPKLNCSISASDVITIPVDGELLYRLNYYGKGSLSRSLPTWFLRTYNNFVSDSLAENKTRFVENPDWFDERIDVETFILMPEEVFYLYTLGYLTVTCCGANVHSRKQLWDILDQRFYHGRFGTRYAVYNHYKRNYVVKSGLQYGGDFGPLA